MRCVTSYGWHFVCEQYLNNMGNCVVRMIQNYALISFLLNHVSDSINSKLYNYIPLRTTCVTERAREKKAINKSMWRAWHGVIWWVHFSKQKTKRSHQNTIWFLLTLSHNLPLFWKMGLYLFYDWKEVFTSLMAIFPLGLKWSNIEPCFPK